MNGDIIKDAFWEELNVWDEVVYKYEWGFSKWVITFIPEKERFTNNASIIVFFYCRTSVFMKKWIEKGKRSKIFTENCVKIS